MPEFDFEEAVDISRAGILYDRLKSLLGQPSPIQLNLEQIANIDGAGVQLIYAFVNTARETGKEVELNKTSDAFVDAVNTIGLSDFFGLPNKPTSN